jgi:hypothetical protein
MVFAVDVFLPKMLDVLRLLRRSFFAPADGAPDAGDL